ncbi:hypothetical protein IVA87_16320 [Bradyrhizobium sp. 147]|uniref:hypothetical protein n=1 Tax=unclassified Bradyrhizobium TaxID=2631580 RepID=UPI001FFA205E|nr:MULTISPECIES: hypothetical protein [unclassified Bradyrhizobium]MCK1680934.1 hypothetical protein [Bradyrhizobium sp. 147]
MKRKRVGLASLRQHPRQYLEDQDRENVARHEGEQDTCAILDHLAPLDPRPSKDRNFVVNTCHGEHRLHAQSGRAERQYKGAIR